MRRAPSHGAESSGQIDRIRSEHALGWNGTLFRLRIDPTRGRIKEHPIGDFSVYGRGNQGHGGFDTLRVDHRPASQAKRRRGKGDNQLPRVRFRCLDQMKSDEAIPPGYSAHLRVA